MRICDYFYIQEKNEHTHIWYLSVHGRNPGYPIDDLAYDLANRIMEFHLRNNQQLLQGWKNRINGGSPLTGTLKKVLEKGFIEPIVGLPENVNSTSVDHLEGYICQALWYFFYIDLCPENLLKVDPPGFKVTDPGGDALAIHRDLDGSLSFRLWEIKKSTGSSTNPHINSTIAAAYRQLKTNAMEYLARYTNIGEYIENEELHKFYGNLVEMWADGSKEASAGVSIATSESQIPADCFSTFGDQFPQFLDPNRLRGMLTGVLDFPAFAKSVREYIWKGI